ncbi:MAG: hypothetical protein JW727_00225 [Candidatus Aenigmarchaeota archaeon]|nr:hypothetical protein [Candidatus Aenigmarchaeota archaeon]
MECRYEISRWRGGRIYGKPYLPAGHWGFFPQETKGPILSDNYTVCSALLLPSKSGLTYAHIVPEYEFLSQLKLALRDNLPLRADLYFVGEDYTAETNATQIEEGLRQVFGGLAVTRHPQADEFDLLVFPDGKATPVITQEEYGCFKASLNLQLS